MQPIHNGLGSEGLFNANAMQAVNICLDSGMVATDACYNDARGIQRVVNVMCYAEDIPDGTCDKHVPVHYCVTGGGAAGEFCGLFPDAEIGTRSLVKLSQAEVNEIREAASTGLVEPHWSDGYVYYMDGAWYGFRGTANQGAEAPYITCPVHNMAAFEGLGNLPGMDDSGATDGETGGGHGSPDAGDGGGGDFG